MSTGSSLVPGRLLRLSTFYHQSAGLSTRRRVTDDCPSRSEVRTVPSRTRSVAAVGAAGSSAAPCTQVVQWGSPASILGPTRAWITTTADAREDPVGYPCTPEHNRSPKLAVERRLVSTMVLTRAGPPGSAVGAGLAKASEQAGRPLHIEGGEAVSSPAASTKQPLAEKHPSIFFTVVLPGPARGRWPGDQGPCPCSLSPVPT